MRERIRSHAATIWPSTQIAAQAFLVAPLMPSSADMNARCRPGKKVTERAARETGDVSTDSCRAARCWY